jgi:DNA-binding LacI/PurR family transcriptional regulator
MMNNENQISKKTKLFGFIAEEAGVSRFSALMNKSFKENGNDAMMIPMNIRADDLYFTLSNMKKSQVDGAVISNEYVAEVPDVLDKASGLVTRSGMCDIVYKEGETLRGDIFGTRVLSEHLKDLRVSRIAIIGVNHHAKAFSFLACGFNVSYFHENLEELMEFTQEVEISNADINRIAVDLSVDFSSFDLVLDFSNISSLTMIEKLAPLNIDMKNNKEFSALKARAKDLNASYTSYDDIIEKFVAKAYQLIK